MTSAEITKYKPPVLYSEWAEYLDILQKNPSCDAELIEAVRSGSFTGTGASLSSLMHRIVDTLNCMADRCVNSFLRKFRECLEFNEINDLHLLFKRLKSDTDDLFFFDELDFISSDLREELEKSVKKQIGDFWNCTVKTLYVRLQEQPDTDLEYALLLIKNIELFS